MAIGVQDSPCRRGRRSDSNDGNATGSATRHLLYLQCRVWVPHARFGSQSRTLFAHLCHAVCLAPRPRTGCSIGFGHSWHPRAQLPSGTHSLGNPRSNAKASATSSTVATGGPEAGATGGPDPHAATSSVAITRSVVTRVRRVVSLPAARASGTNGDGCSGATLRFAPRSAFRSPAQGRGLAAKPDATRGASARPRKTSRHCCCLLLGLMPRGCRGRRGSSRRSPPPGRAPARHLRWREWVSWLPRADSRLRCRRRRQPRPVEMKGAG